MSVSNRLRRIAQLLILVGISIYGAPAIEAARQTCAEWYFSTQDRAEQICQAYGGRASQEGDCWCYEDEWGVVESECNYVCMYS